jgi:hypothetical protein
MQRETEVEAGIKTADGLCERIPTKKTLNLYFTRTSQLITVKEEILCSKVKVTVGCRFGRNMALTMVKGT